MGSTPPENPGDVGSEGGGESGEESAPTSARVPKGYRPQPVMPSSRGGPVGLLSGPRVTYPQTRAIVLGALAVVGSLVLYRVMSGKRLVENRDKLLEEQRTVAATAGSQWIAFKDETEVAVVDALKALPGDDLIPTEGWDFRPEEGFYIRLLARDAKDRIGIEAAAMKSVGDSFATCLLRTKRVPDAGVFPETPWNLGEAYTWAKVLAPNWIESVKNVDGEFSLRVFRLQFDQAVSNDIPKLNSGIRNARFLLALIDEETPQSKTAGASTMEGLQLFQHPIRILVHRFADHKAYARMMLTPAGDYLLSGETPGQKPVEDERTQAAMKRQAMNCGLAKDVTRALKLEK